LEVTLDSFFFLYIAVNCKLLTVNYVAATHPKWQAVASSERTAAYVPFQPHSESHPPTKNVNSALASLAPAVQFSGQLPYSANNQLFSGLTVTV